MTISVKPLINKEEGVVWLEKWWGRGSGVAIRIQMNPRVYEAYIVVGHRVVQRTSHDRLKDALNAVRRMGYQILITPETLEALKKASRET